MKRRLAAALAATLLVGLPAVAWAPAHASAGCVTKAEFNAIKVGWTKARAHRKLGTAGSRTAYSSHANHAFEVRNYIACDMPGSNVSISFEKAQTQTTLRVTHKQAVWIG